MDIFYEADANLSLIKERKLAIFGYGNQGRAQALNLRDSGADLIIALREDSSGFPKVKADGLSALSLEKASETADVFVILTPDETHAALFHIIKPYLREGTLLLFAHGFSVHFNLITLPPYVDTALIAPKGPGTKLRQAYEKGGGLAALLAVHQDATGQAFDLALSYAAALGCGRAGVMTTSFAEECVCDLFGEQSVLCGGMVALARMAFEVLVEAGYAPEMAYYDCVQEMKLIADLIHEQGPASMYEAVSDTAEFGGYQTGGRLITEETRTIMKACLEEIQNGRFAKNWMAEHAGGKSGLLAQRHTLQKHPIEAAGEHIRRLAPPVLKSQEQIPQKNRA